MIAGHKGVGKITELSRDYFASGAADSVSQAALRSLRFQRAAQTTDEFLARQELLRSKDESEMQMGGEIGSFRLVSQSAENLPSLW